MSVGNYPLETTLVPFSGPCPLFRSLGQLALFAAYAKRYELAVELSDKVLMLSTSGSHAMDLSARDRHPVLYAVTELQKQQQFD